MADELPRNGGGGSRPVPDPTLLTTEQLLREVAALRSYVDARNEIQDQRLRGIDEATRLRIGTIEGIMPEVEAKIAYERSLTDERFRSVDQRLTERDTRLEKVESLNKVALDAAFAAQKEAASEQNKSNTLAIDKSEKATAETLTKQADLFKSTTDALSDKIDDLKTRVGIVDATMIGMVQRTAGGRESTTDNRATVGYIMAGVLFVITIGTTILAIFAQTGGP